MENNEFLDEVVPDSMDIVPDSFDSEEHSGNGDDEVSSAIRKLQPDPPSCVVKTSKGASVIIEEGSNGFVGDSVDLVEHSHGDIEEETVEYTRRISMKGKEVFDLNKLPDDLGVTSMDIEEDESPTTLCSTNKLFDLNKYPDEGLDFGFEKEEHNKVVHAMLKIYLDKFY